MKGADDNLVKVWSINDTRSPIYQFKGHEYSEQGNEHTIIDVAVDYDNTLIAAGNDTGMDVNHYFLLLNRF